MLEYFLSEIIFFPSTHNIKIYYFCYEGIIPSCCAEEIFLCRVLESDSIESRGNDGLLVYIKEALALRHSSTRELMKVLEDTIESQRAKTQSISQALIGKPSAEGEDRHL